ncbi:MAG: alpha/beta fold hydrolase [Myxococcaceae bacterium]
MKHLLIMIPLFATACLPFHKGPMPGEPKGTYAELLDTRVRYQDIGKGPAVVLLHGFASSLETWLPVAPKLATSHRVISLDLKGFGWTDRPEGDYSPRAQAELVFALMDKLGVHDAAIVAHSWGASVALEMALLHPDRVRRLGLYDAWLYEEQLPTFFIWARQPRVGEALFATYYDQRPGEKISLAFFNQSFVTEQLVEDVERALLRPGTKAAALAAVRGQRYSEIQQQYRRIDKPALILWGEQDRVTPIAVGQRLASELPRSKLVVYPRCGHFPMLEASAQSTDMLASFLAEDVNP